MVTFFQDNQDKDNQNGVDYVKSENYNLLSISIKLFKKKELFKEIFISILNGNLAMLLLNGFVKKWKFIVNLVTLWSI